MKKAICLAVAVVMVLAVAGVASAENKIGVGYYFAEGYKDFTLVGELSLSDKVSFGFDYMKLGVGSMTDIYGKLALRSFGAASVGAFGGMKLIGVDPVSFNAFTIGVYGEQPVSAEIELYGRGGAVFMKDVGTWFEVRGGVKANVLSPFWLAGEGYYLTGIDTLDISASTTAFRVLVGMNF